MADYTDEEFVSIANKGLYSFLAQRSKTSHCTIEHCYIFQKENIKNYLQSHKTRPWEKLTSEEKLQMNADLKRLKPALDKSSEEILLRVQKDQTIQSINTSTTEALVRSYLEENNIPLRYFYEQKYRAKIIIMLENNKRLTLYIRYKQALEDLEQVPQTVADANRMIAIFGHDVKLI